jgi:hypothetical protein
MDQGKASNAVGIAAGIVTVRLSTLSSWIKRHISDMATMQLN